MRIADLKVIGRRAEDRSQMTDDRGQKTDDRRQMTEVRGKEWLLVIRYWLK
ncbi:hypothetical protein D1AOALGA4SA_11510 [Olavius algarvensis Delta 1 endosymbiont]|nr:hypothetical protein D1AOALGA4SA_11510 [Olavius algarvensis Delta 1 endosymbiont]